MNIEDCQVQFYQSLFDKNELSGTKYNAGEAAIEKMKADIIDYYYIPGIENSLNGAPDARRGATYYISSHPYHVP